MAEIRVWDKKSIQDLLARSDKAVERAILAIYARQTEDEKGGGTKWKNGMGFGAFDAGYFTQRAKFILEDQKHGRNFTPYLAEQARRRGIKRYWRQLAEIANENELRKAQENAAGADFKWNTHS